MKKLNWIIYMLAVSVLFGACTKNDDDDDDDNNTDTDVWSTQTIEENKAALEADGLALLDEVKDMESSEAVDVSASMEYFMDYSDPFNNNPEMDWDKSSYIVKPFFALDQIGEGGIEIIFNALKSTMVEPETLLEGWDYMTGTYSWNSSSYQWDYTDNDDNITFNFPSTEGGTTNDASLVVSGFTVWEGVIDFIDEDETWEGGLPTGVTVALNLNQTAIATFVFTASYDNDGIPTSMTGSLSFSGFSTSVSMTNQVNTSTTASCELSHDGSTLILASLGVNGDWSADNIDANTVIETEYYYWLEWNWETEQYDTVWYTDEYEVFNGHNVFRSGNATFQVMNTKIMGTVNIKNIGDAEENIYEDEDDPDFDWDAATEQEAATINENVDLTVRYADNNQIIAKAEAYTFDDIDYEWVWDDDLMDWVEVEVTEKELGLRFRFSDNSTIDAETYFDEGFDDLIDELEEFLDELEEEWDL